MLSRLLKAIALQTGSQVSYSEAGSLVGLDLETVELYFNILKRRSSYSASATSRATCAMN